MIRIALDGLSGSGKGALADGLAQKLDIIHLDTGAIFRGIAVGFLELNLTDPNDAEIAENVNKLSVEIKFEEGKQKIYLNGKDVTSELRKEEVSKLASKISAHGEIREKYLEIVRVFANDNSCIIDGRDIGSIVLPDADYKIYLTADEDVRAKRRFLENQQRGLETTYEEVLANLQERDYRDTHRDIAPLVVVPDAIVVDNSKMDIDQTIEYCLKFIKK